MHEDRAEVAVQCNLVGADLTSEEPAHGTRLASTQIRPHALRENDAEWGGGREHHAPLRCSSERFSPKFFRSAEKIRVEVPA